MKIETGHTYPCKYIPYWQRDEKRNSDEERTEENNYTFIKSKTKI